MTAEDAIAYLLKHDILAPRDFVRGEVRVTDRSARNAGLQVQCTTRSGFFIKRGTADRGRGNVASESAFYEYVRDDIALAALRPCIPTLRRSDSERNLLVIDLIADTPTARAAAHGTSHDPAASGLAPFAGPLGATLATIHTIAREQDAPTRARFTQMVPWAFRLVFPAPADFRDLSALQLEILKLIQRQSDITDSVRQRRRGWTFECLTHGDVRSENLLCVGPAPHAPAPSICVIDWEHAGLGDPAWDVACALQGWIAHAIETLTLRDDDDPARASQQFAAALPALQAQMQKFLESYIATMRATDADSMVMLERAAGYLPLRILQTAWEWAGERPRMTPFILLTLQLSINLLQRPASVSLALMGANTA